jgi:hypothetical protein
MPYYRLYPHDAKGRIHGVTEAFVDTDEAAMEHARSLGHLMNVEVWQEKRKVGVAEPSR